MRNALALAISLVAGVTVGHALTRVSPSTAASSEQQVPTQERERILDLIALYGHAWDNNEAERWTSLFTDDAISQNYNAGQLVSEAQSGAERLARAKERHGMFAESGIQTRHFQTNTLLTKQSDGSVAGETVFWVSWQYTGEAAPKLVHTGVYVDRFVQTEAGWRFARREVRFDHE